MTTLLRLLHCHPLQVLAYPVPSPKFLPRDRRNLRSKHNVRGKDPTFSGLVSVPFALAESSDSPKSIDPASRSLLLELAESFDLPSDYFSLLPNDLRLDRKECTSAMPHAAEAPIEERKLISKEGDTSLNDAAFDLSNGPVTDQCGEELGELLLNLSRSWELADTSTSKTLVGKLSSLESTLTDKAKSALGKRLQAAGRRFQSTGQYGQGELQRIAKAMISTGKQFAATQVSDTSLEQPKKEARMFKFGELQVAITSDKANIGAAIGFVFGILSWQLAQGIQSIPESSLQYANDNALLLAKSLRGALLVIGYSSAVLSLFASVGLLLLARQLDSKEQ